MRCRKIVARNGIPLILMIPPVSYIVLYLDIIVRGRGVTLVPMSLVACIVVLPLREPILVPNMSSVATISSLSTCKLHMVGTESANISV